MQVEGKAALVTGSSSGVGRATALALARRGCDVAVHYQQSRSEAEAVVAEIKSAGRRAVALQADVADDAQCRRLVDEAVQALGRLEILVNSAGTTRFIPHPALERVADEDWDHILGVNLKGPFQCIRAARPYLEAAGSAEVVNVASIAGIAATGSSIPYAASKAALINMTVALARALAPTIRINAVAPGFITGRWLERGLGEQYQAVKQKVEQRAPLGRVCRPEDVADAILGLITGSDLVTGQTLVVDGGMLIADALAPPAQRRAKGMAE
ncbi:MAG TPA: SDR family NAD(P)-dependent oxidoreductase [Pirellulales bacterium]|jgi:3-oxoacyl-[acyl-carrier protein] reductase|nr:SDR family NAD(P)-dependent oxidoreductase [Pirellulales bacterium]